MNGPSTRPLAERLPLNCPVCGLRVDYIRWHGGSRFYRCRTHGAIVLKPNGEVDPDDPDTSAIVH